MSKIKSSSPYLNVLIQEKLNNKNLTHLENTSFVDIVRSLEKNLELINELDLAKDFKNDILKSINNEDILYNNLILNYGNICEYTNKSDLLESDKNDLLEVFKFLDNESLCMIVEPNKNIYLGLDYDLLIHNLQKYISPEAYRALFLHKKVQQTAFIDSNGTLLDESISKLSKSTVIDCDFEKNPVIFSYSCEALDTIEFTKRLYSRIYK